MGYARSLCGVGTGLISGRAGFGFDVIELDRKISLRLGHGRCRHRLVSIVLVVAETHATTLPKTGIRASILDRAINSTLEGAGGTRVWTTSYTPGGGVYIFFFWMHPLKHTSSHPILRRGQGLPLRKWQGLVMALNKLERHTLWPSISLGITISHPGCRYFLKLLYKDFGIGV